jgi:hypothetical protein
MREILPHAMDRTGKKQGNQSTLWQDGAPGHSPWTTATVVLATCIAGQHVFDDEQPKAFY